MRLVLTVVYTVLAWVAWGTRSDALERLRAPSVAIVGAGIGGSTSAWFVREHLGPGVTIDVFEQSEVGGRTQVFNFSGEVFETGASIIHAQNKYFRELADRVGLKRLELGGDTSQISIFDGHYFVFNESSWSIVTLYRMLRRYGTSYFYMRQGPRTMLQRYLKLYDLQAAGQFFDTPEALLKAVDLYNLTQRSFREELQDRIGTSKGAKLFAEEFVAGINRIQYNQGNGINALAGVIAKCLRDKRQELLKLVPELVPLSSIGWRAAGMVSLLPTIDGRLFKIKGGNYQLAQRLLRAADAELHPNQTVTRLHKTAQGKLELHVRHSSVSSRTQVLGQYDAVVVATPLELTALDFSGFKVPVMPHRRYQTTVTTLMRGRLRPDYFGVQSLPTGEYVMVTEDADTPFSVIGPQKTLPDGLRIYKLFSRAVLDLATLQQIFSNLTVLHQRKWKAYPHFDPPEAFPPFKLTEGICLNNAWENAASAMEMSAVAAKNCALLVAAHLNQTQIATARDAAPGSLGDQAEL